VWFLSRLFFDSLHRRRQLPFIIRGLRDLLPDDQLNGRFDGDLRVVALHKSLRSFQNARFRSRKAVLRDFELLTT
jgi:hypothetical protein